jgi:hypothetical protein
MRMTSRRSLASFAGIVAPLRFAGLAVAAYSFSLLSGPTLPADSFRRMGGLPIGRLRSEVDESSVLSRV